MSFRSLSELSHRRCARFAPATLLSFTCFILAAAIAVTAGLTGLADLARGQSPPPSTTKPPGSGTKPATSRPASDPVIARVQRESILLSEVEARRKRNMEAYERTTGNEVPGGYELYFLRAATEEAVRERLIRRDGEARGIRVSDASAESIMKLDSYFQTGGKFDAAKFEAYRTQNPRSFTDARTQAKNYLLYLASARGLEARFAPDAATIESHWIARGSKVRVRYALVSEAHYDGEVDPTDEELRAYYERTKEDYATPAVVFVSTLGVTPASATPEGSEAARTQAKELLRAAESGTPFDSLATRPGVTRGTSSWQAGQPRGVFEADTALARMAAASAPGRVLPRLVTTPEGFGIARVDRVNPRVERPLHDVAVDVRARWRSEKMRERATAEARRYYDAHPDSFRTRAWNVRWATVDSARVRPKTPSEKELRAWFEARKNEFARLDPSGSGIQLQSFEEARPRVEERWRNERLGLEARRLADELAVAWSKGKDPKAASNAVTIGGPAWLAEGGAIPAGLPPGLADSARTLTPERRALVTGAPGGFAVVGLVRRTDNEPVAFETVAPIIETRLGAERVETERREARAWFETVRDRYRTGPGYAIGYATAAPPPVATVDVPGSTIERYYREHGNEYGTPPEVHVRHILVGTQGRTDAEAQALARTLLSRARSGDNFAPLAAQYSDDPGSKEKGGDLGWLKPGATVPEFDRAAFSLTRARQITGPVKTEFGYHILQLLERREGTVPPFADVRGEIGAKLAAQYADTLARKTAEKLRREARSYDDLIRIAGERRLTTALVRWYDGLPLVGPATLDVVRADAPGVSPRGLFPREYRYLDQGYVVVALDSIMPARALEFEEIEGRVIADWKQERRLAAARARADKISADLAAGRPWSEALATAGGSMESELLARGDGLPQVGAVPGLDSLLFGPSADTIAVGSWGRVPTPRGELFLQVVERRPPDPATAARDRQNVRDLIVTRRLYEYTENLRKQYTVEVLRPDLAERIPAPPIL
jgi:hypothetical protein